MQPTTVQTAAGPSATTAQVVGVLSPALRTALKTRRRTDDA